MDQKDNSDEIARGVSKALIWFFLMLVGLILFIKGLYDMGIF